MKMKSNLQKVSALLVVCGFLFLGPLFNFAFAEDNPCNPNTCSGVNPLCRIENGDAVCYAVPQICQLTTVIVNGFNMIIAIFPLVGLAVLMFGAFLWATAASDPQKVQQSQQTLTYGVVGLVLGLSAIAIIGTLQMLLIGKEKFQWIDDGFMKVDFCFDEYMNYEEVTSDDDDGDTPPQ